MVRYRRNLRPGGSYFFTVTLADRRSTALVDHVGALRDAFREVRRERPFSIDAVVILPDHLHAILSLPSGDADFPGRWRRIKGHFSGGLMVRGIAMKRRSNGDLALWQRRVLGNPLRDESGFGGPPAYIHFNPPKQRPVCPARGWAMFFVLSPARV